MSDEKSQKIELVDLEKQNGPEAVEEENNEPLEKVKEKPPPGINASLVLLYALFFAVFTIGWVNLNNCSISRLIPIYLIVTGFAGAIAKFVSRFHNKYLFNVTATLVIFYFTWHGLGTYWVYKEYQPNYNSSLGKYCDRTTYLSAFWMLTIQYSLFGFMILSFMCYVIMKDGFKRK